VKYLIALMLVSALAAQVQDRARPPDTPPVPDYRLPNVFETKLDNGLRVMLVEDNRFPLVTVRLGFLAGSRFDPAEIPGLSESVGAMLTEGTARRTSRQIAEELAAIGGQLNGVSSPDGLTLAGSALSESTPRLLDLLADVARNASFPEEEVALHKQNRKQSLLEQRSDPGYLAEEEATRAVFGSHPYAHIGPTMESIDRISRVTLAGFRDRLLAPNNATLILLGRLPSRDRTLELVRNAFGSWQSRELPAPPAPRFPEDRKQVILVDRPGSVQADIRIARRAVTRRDPDYFPLLAGHTVLGGGTSSRMFLEIREKKGYAYDAHSEFDAHRDAGIFGAVTQVRNEVIGDALDAVIKEMQRMGAERVPAGELSDVKNYLSGRFVLGLETQNGLANSLNMIGTMGLTTAYLENYTTRIRAVEPDQVQAAARKYVSPEKSAVVVVGDAAKIGETVKKLGEVRTVKPNP